LRGGGLYPPDDITVRKISLPPPPLSHMLDIGRGSTHHRLLNKFLKRGGQIYFWGGGIYKGRQTNRQTCVYRHREREKKGERERVTERSYNINGLQ